MEFKLNENQLKNLNVFLDRTDLKGTETLAFLELKRIFNLNILENRTSVSKSKQHPTLKG